MRRGRLDWRSERGSSTALLLVTFMVMIGFLGYAVDLALAEVYREQLRTAAEAAATAGALDADLYMTVQLSRSHSVVDSAEACEPGRVVTVPPTPCPRVNYWKDNGTDTVDLSGWEKDVWTPHTWRKQPLSQVFPAYCNGATPDARWLAEGSTWVSCTQKEIKACQIRPSPTARWDRAAQATFDRNSTRWAGRMTAGITDLRLENPGTSFRVYVTVEGSMPTIFLRSFGIPAHPIVVRGADGTGAVMGEWRRAGTPPQGCPNGRP